MPQGSIFRSLHLCWAVAPCLLACLMGTGCSSLMPDKQEVEEEVTQRPQARGGYVVELETGSRSPKLQNFELVGYPTVQDALEQAGALKKFGNMELTLIRTVPGTNRRHKMQVEYDPKQDRVRPEQNYSLHPNDHLVVRAKGDNPFDSLFSSGLGSLADIP